MSSSFSSPRAFNLWENLRKTDDICVVGVFGFLDDFDLTDVTFKKEVLFGFSSSDDFLAMSESSMAEFPDSRSFELPVRILGVASVTRDCVDSFKGIQLSPVSPKARFRPLEMSESISSSRRMGIWPELSTLGWFRRVGENDVE
ncbi:hypothetical protein OGAPHI_000065 [Ogataea philodendri]|uniref:Uncharacterized protein n=1 Tax=Ogataea philodendri TaxID=1378263 RepID=A0A9P8PII1_9ASCO|nr:uncharacterized protein OGAPHI_000065 [Ogataea philodendri]KAH3671879.1 hypothetical protein OGAPHI_000065 [Ogataea philodendri]